MRSFNPFFDVTRGEELTFMERVRKAFWVLNGKNDVQTSKRSMQHVGLLEYLLFPVSIVELGITWLEMLGYAGQKALDDVDNSGKALSLDRVFLYAGKALIIPLVLVASLIVKPILEILRNVVAGVLTLVALPIILSVHLWPEKKAGYDTELPKAMEGENATRGMYEKVGSAAQGSSMEMSTKKTTKSADRTQFLDDGRDRSIAEEDQAAIWQAPRSGTSSYRK